MTPEELADIQTNKDMSTHIESILNRQADIRVENRVLDETNITKLNELYSQVITNLKDLLTSV